MFVYPAETTFSCCSEKVAEFVLNELLFQMSLQYIVSFARQSDGNDLPDISCLIYRSELNVAEGQ